jgi:gliding motility-associated-like protein
MFFESRAKHIVGGFMSYAYVSGTTYNITLNVYRDCTPGNPLFDGENGSGDTCFIGIFDASNNLVNVLNLFNPTVTSIGPPINNPCLQVNNSICVEQGTYNFQITLPSATEGYTIEYQRCCRNNSVTNMLNSGGEGAVYSVYVPPTSTYHNSSPVFNSFPPIFVCLSSGLVIDNSATDPDGDVLRYSLCTPYTAGSANYPIPEPPQSPPYDNINWAPGYSLANLMGGVPVAIDSITGVLTGIPNSQGIFDVGVCVSEYRNGQLIGTYLRDFQFNVVQCNVPIPSIPSYDINASTHIGLYEVNCNNLTVTFENNTSPTPDGSAIGFYWNFGVTGSTTDTSSQTYPTYTFPDTGTYLVTLIAYKQNDTSCRDTTYAYVKIYPTFTTKFGTANVCQNEPAYFFDSTVCTQGFINSWIWHFGDGNISGLENPSHQYAAGGTYTVSLIDESNLGCSDTATGTITVYPAPNANFTFGPTCINAPITFTDANGNISTYLWSFGDGSATTNLPGPTHTYSSATPYTVTLIASSSNGCLDTVSETINVHPLPTIVASNDTIICPYDSTQLSASGGVSYSWTPSAGLNDTSIATPVAMPQPPAPFTYTVYGTDQNQCVNSDSVTISFHPFPQISAGPDTSVCLNQSFYHDSVLLTATGGVSYQWSPATGLNSTNIASPLSKPPYNITYYVFGTDTNGCSTTDSVNVFVLDPSLNLIQQDSIPICLHDTAHATILNQGASSYVWSPAQFLTNDTSWSTGFFPPDTTDYILTVSNYCYQNKVDSILIIVWPLPQLALNPLDSICISDSIQLNAADAAKYLWSPAATLSNDTIGNPFAMPITSTEYYVTGTSQFGCVSHDSTYIIVYSPSVLTVSAAKPFGCQDSTLQLTASGAYTYSWTPAAGLNDSAIANPVATLQDTTEFYVTGTNIHGCKTLDSLHINVELHVVAIAPSPYDTCRGIPVQLFASGGLYYSWSPDAGLSNANSSQPFATPDTSMIYLVHVSNDCFYDSAYVTVNIHQPPYVDAGPDTTIYRDTYAQLHGTTSASSYFWNPSTYLSDANDLNTNASPQQTTLYELFATNEFGCLGVDSVLVTVEPYTVLDIPTGFSPNGDGVNDIFHVVKYLNIDHLEEFSVYNRWGERVFSTDNITEGWDGTFSGKPAPVGVYVWIVIAVTQEGDKVTRKGNITLIR